MKKEIEEIVEGMKQHLLWIDDPQKMLEKTLIELLKSHEENMLERIQKGIDKEIKPLKTSDPDIKQVRKFNQGLQKALEVVEKELLGKE